MSGGSNSRRCGAAWVVDHALELALGQIARRRGCPRVAQQALRRHDNQRPRVSGQQRGLAAQQVEILPGAGAVGHSNIFTGGELQEALQTSAGVLGPLALVAMW